MKHFFFGFALLGFVIAVVCLILQYQTNNTLKQEIVLIKTQTEQISKDQFAFQEIAQKQYGGQLNELKNTVKTLGQTLTESQAQVRMIEEEKLYRSGEKNFAFLCKGMKPVGSRDLFTRPYFNDLSSAIKTLKQPFTKPASGLIVPEHKTLHFPWESSNNFTIFSVCEDGDTVYLFAEYVPEISDMFFGVAKFSVQNKKISFETTSNILFYVKEFIKEKDIIRFVPNERCFSDGDFYVSCDSDKASQPLEKVPQPEILYSMESNTFIVKQAQ